MLVEFLLTGAVFPMAMAAAIALLWRRVHRNSVMADLLAPVAMTAGYMIGHAGIANGLQLQPSDVTHYLPHLAFVAAFWGIIALRLQTRPQLQRLGDVAVAVSATLLLLSPIWGRRLSGVTGGLIAALVAMAWVVTARALSVANRALKLAPWAAVVALMMAAAAVTIAASGSLLIARFMGGAAAAVAGVALVAWLARVEVRLVVGGRVPAMLLWGGALLSFAYAKLHVAALAALVLAAPVMAVAALGTRDRSGIRRLGLVTVATMVPLCAAVALAATVGQPKPAQSTPAASSGSASPGSAGSSEAADDNYGYE